MQATKVRQDTAVTIETAQRVTLKQSTEVVQTLLHSSVSELLYMRLLLPDESFINIDYPFKADVDYEAFSKGKHVDRNVSRGHRTNIHLIRRDRAPGADMLLDWLQKGAFEALQRRWLLAMQLNVHTDSTEPRRVVESYTFSFTYSEPSEDEHSVSLSFDSLGGRKIDLKDIRYALHTFLRQLVGICKTLPHLPDRRYLSMNLFYTHDCPDDYQPAFFQTSNATQQNFACSEQWKPKSTCVGSVDSGYHQVSLSLTSISNELEGCPSGTDLYIIPSRLDQTVQRACDFDVMKAGVIDIQTMSETNRPEAIAAQATEPTAVIGVSSGQKLGHVRRVDVGRASVRGVKDDSQQATLMRNELIALLDSQKISESLEETQPVPQDLLSSYEDRCLPDKEVALVYSHAKLKQLRKSSSFSDGARSRREESISTSDEGDTHDVQCNCGTNQKGRYDDLIGCDFCSRWQHVHCYGFRGLNDKRIPSLHACYTCLLDGRDEETLQRLRDLSLQRSVVNIVEREGMSSIKSLSEKMSCKFSTARHAVGLLKAKQFLTYGPGKRRRARSQSNPNPQYMVLVKDGEAHQRMLSELFDPSTEITQHLDPATGQASEPMISGCIADAVGVSPLSRPMRQHLKRPVETDNVEAPVGSLKRLKMSQSRGELDVSHWSPGHQ